MVINRLIPNFLIASRTRAWLSVRSRGGLVGLLNGESLVRTEARAMIIASGREGVVMAASMDGVERGEPVVIVRPGEGVRDVGSRTRAVTVCEAERASWRMSFPVRPLAPRSRMCIFLLFLLLLNLKIALKAGLSDFEG